MLKVKGKCPAPFGGCKMKFKQMEFEVEALDAHEFESDDDGKYNGTSFKPLKKGHIVKMKIWHCYMDNRWLIAEYNNRWIHKPKKKDKYEFAAYKKVKKMFNKGKFYDFSS